MIGIGTSVRIYGNAMVSDGKHHIGQVSENLR